MIVPLLLLNQHYQKTKRSLNTHLRLQQLYAGNALNKALRKNGVLGLQALGYKNDITGLKLLVTDRKYESRDLIEQLELKLVLQLKLIQKLHEQLFT